MSPNTFFNSFCRAAILLAAVGLMGGAQAASAQKRLAPAQPNSLKHSDPFAPVQYCASDFNGDRRTDMAFFNSSTAEWMIHNSDDTVSSLTYGAPGDRPLAADYDGDGIVDITVVHNDGGKLHWQTLFSYGGVISDVPWGLDTDVPVQGDFDGDGKADCAVWRPSNGFWYIRASSTGELMMFECGLSGDRAVPGDYDGDGRTDAATFRPGDNTFYLYSGSDQPLRQQLWQQPFNKDNASFVPADYDSDGRTDFAIFDTKDGLWYILESSTGKYRIEAFEANSNCAPWETLPCGVSGDAVPADYNNDGRIDPAVWNYNDGMVTAHISSNDLMKLTAEKGLEMTPVSALFAKQ